MNLQIGCVAEDAVGGLFDLVIKIGILENRRFKEKIFFCQIFQKISNSKPLFVYADSIIAILTRKESI